MISNLICAMTSDGEGQFFPLHQRAGTMEEFFFQFRIEFTIHYSLSEICLMIRSNV